jgi:hypothetical protein
LWRKMERSKSMVLLQIGGFDVPLATALCKTFLLRMLNYSWAGQNPTKGCSADWRRVRRTLYNINCPYGAAHILYFSFNLIAMSPKELPGHLKFCMDIKHTHITIMDMVAVQIPLIWRRQFSRAQSLYIRNTPRKNTHKKKQYFLNTQNCK